MSTKISTSDLYPYFAQARADIARTRAEWEREAREYAEQGFRPSHCIHGTYLWVDYDCACYMCEMSLTDLQWAVRIAHEYYEEANRKCAVCELSPRKVYQSVWTGEDCVLCHPVVTIHDHDNTTLADVCDEPICNAHFWKLVNKEVVG